MGTTTPINGYPVPAGSDPNNIPADLAALIAVLEQGSPNKRLTQAQIDALTPAQKPNGLMVVNITTGRVQMSDGATFKNVSGITINDDGSVVVKSVIVKDGAAEALRLWLNGGTAMVDSGVAGRPLRLTSGLTTIALTYGSGATLSPQTAPGDGPSNLVTKGYVDGLGVWQDWSPVLTLSAGTPVNWAATGRFARVGKTVAARFQVSFDSGIGTSTGAALRVSLPVAAAAALPGTPVGSARMNRMAAGGFPRADVLLPSTSYVEFDSGALRWADNAPHSLAAGDVITAQFTYEMA